MRRDRQGSKSGTINRRALFRYGAAGGVVVAVEQAIGRAAPALAPEAKPEPFELEEATVTDLQKRMVVGEETARSLVEKYAARIEALDKRGPALRTGARAAPRDPGSLEGQHRDLRSHDDDGGIARARGLHSLRRRLRREDAPRIGRGPPRQDEPLGMGELPLDALLLRLERTRRAVPQSLCARPQRLRIELRLGRRRGGKPVRGRRRQ